MRVRLARRMRGIKRREEKCFSELVTGKFRETIGTRCNEIALREHGRGKSNELV